MAGTIIPIKVSKKHIIYSEILAVTSAMRKNSRWASTSQAYTARDAALATSLGLRRAGNFTQQSSNGERDDVELMTGFLDLKREVRDVEEIDKLPLNTLFAPFFALIRSPLSTGPITSAALYAIHNIFLAGFVTPNALGLDVTLIELSNTVSRCKFEASDASGDEVVLFRIMAVIKECMCGDVGHWLGDVEVCEMLETVLTTCCQMRLSEILRRSAESTMHSLVRQVFHRLHSLDSVEEEKKLQNGDDDPQSTEITMNVQVSQEPHPQLESIEGAQPDQPVVSEELPAPEPVQPTPSELTVARQEYGLPSILELLRVLINILDPNDRAHTDSTRLTALGIVNAAFEVSGSRIGDFPSLAALILDHGCKYLFQLARSDNPTVLYMSLRVISTMFDALRGHLKLQQELFFAFTIDRLAPAISLKAQQSHAQRKILTASPRPGTPVTPSPGMATPPINGEGESENVGPTRPTVMPARGETRELMLETLNHIARQPSFMVDLYINYDCDVNCEDLFEKLIDFLAKGVYPMHYADGRDTQQAPQLLCLDLLLEFIKNMAGRVAGNIEPWPATFPTPDDLLQSKSRKRLVLTGASRFNTKPKAGLSFLEENRLIYSDLSEEMSRPKSLAKFLKSSTRLDKRLLGDFISRAENIEVLKAFISLFDFTDKPISEAMREMLEAFRLPGESQQISRITETFAEYYFASKPADINSQDAIYVLAYSVIMLNTDLHNPQNKKRMTVEDYQRNLRGVNDGSDFPPEFLKAIYDSIRKREIVMPEEHTGRVGFEYAWKELLARSRISGPFISCNSDAFDLAMFKSVWKSVISAIAFAFTNFDDDYTVQRAIAGFRRCATLAGRFQLPDVFDYIVVSLSQVTNLLPETFMSRVPNYPVVEVEGQDLTVSTLSVNFGTNFKGQLAAVVLFTIVNGNGNAIREGWTQIFEMFQNLFLHSLLPTRMLQMEDFLGGVSMIPLQSNRPTSPPAARGDGGLLSALSSYLMTPYGSSADSVIPEATDAEVENTLCTIDCISACRLDELYGQIIQLEPDALVSAVRALEALAHERTVARLQQESDETPGQSSNGRPRTLPYDAASVYLLETMVSISLQTSQHIEEVWPVIFEHLSALLSSSAQYSVLLIERAVVGLLRLCLLLSDKPSVRDQLYVSLDLLGHLPPVVVASVGEQVMSGLALLVKNHRAIIRSQTEWGLVFAVIRNNMSHPEAARQAFELLLSLASDGPDQSVKPDNFAGLVSLLDDYATAAGLATETHGHNMRRIAAQSPQEFVVERGRKAVDVIFDLKKFILQFVENGVMSQAQAWKQLSLPLIAALGHQSTNTCREVRHGALIQLQRTLLGPQIVIEDGNHAQVETIFNRVVFPLLDELLKPQVFRRDPQGMPETRLRASALLCKVFMHFEIRDAQKQVDIRVTWIQILDLLDRLMNIDRRDQLYEAIPESLKNVVLVMNASDFLVPPSANDSRTPQQCALWDATHERMERFLPGFLAEVLPPSREASHPSLQMSEAVPFPGSPLAPTTPH